MSDGVAELPNRNQNVWVQGRRAAEPVRRFGGFFVCGKDCRMRRDETGFFLLMSMAVLAGLLTLATVGLARSTTELLATQRFIDKIQAFHAAEAGLDRALKEQLTGSFSSTDITTNLLGKTLFDKAALPSSTYTVTVTDNDDGDSNLATDTDGRVILHAQGTSGKVNQTLRVTVQLAQLVNPNTMFEYSLAGSYMALEGNAVIGNINDRASIYVDSFQLDTTSANNIWASKMDFYNPYNTPLTGPSGLCPNCLNASIFHPTVTFNLQAKKITDTKIDLKPYYTEALTEPPVYYNYRGQNINMHHITQDVTFDGSQLPGGSFSGVMYVECGADVTFSGNVTVKGTIVHEGLCNTQNFGYIKIASQGSLTIDSWNGTQFTQGLAIVGQPRISFPNQSSIDITGFVMADGNSMLAATGIIRGGVMGVNAQAPTNYPELINNPGPGSYATITWVISSLGIGGGTQIIFKPLPGTPIVFPPDGNGSTKPIVLLWSED